MRRALAALTDAAIMGWLGYGAFRMVYAVTPCDNPGNCFPLTPLVILALLLVIALFIVLSIRLLGRTPGQWLFRIR